MKTYRIVLLSFLLAALIVAPTLAAVNFQNFTVNGTFNVPAGVTNITVLIVAAVVQFFTGRSIKGAE